MATRARIGIENADGTVTTSYHHWDGYPAGLGYNLVQNWSERDKLAEAIALGDASHWGSKIGVKCDFNNRDSIPEDQNVYYGRDRGESNVGPVVFDSIDSFLADYNCAGEEFGYVYTVDGLWVMNSRYGGTTDWDAAHSILEARQKLEEKIG
jgi:hypothetical protein